MRSVARWRGADDRPGAVDADSADRPPALDAGAGSLSPPKPSTAGRAYLGLALLGWGLSILLGVTPHEDRVVGVGLAVFGAALVATAPRLPDFPGLRAGLLAGAGLAIVAFVVGYVFAFDAAWDIPKGTLVLLGLGLLAAAPFLDRRVKVGRKGRTIPVSAIAVSGIAVLGAPLAVWGVQALAKGVVKTTPLEWFVQYGLVMPLGWFLQLVGLGPATNGQTITYATRGGSMALEVGAACSGVQAMALFGAVLGLFLWTERPGGRRLALWTAIGMGGVYVANLLRLAFLSLVGYQWGAEALMQAHAQAGWIFFVAWALLFAWLARRTSPGPKRIVPGSI